jgi:Fe-S cluster assembly protein SufD
MRAGQKELGVTAIDTDDIPDTARTAVPSAHSHGQVGPTGSPAERFTSTNPDDFAVPTGREEEWRFTPLRRLRAVLRPYVSEGTEDVSVTGPTGARWSLVGRDDPRFGSVLRPADRVSALALANVQQALLIEIDAEAQLDAPVTVSVVGRPGLNYGHVIVDAKPFSSATVVFDHTGETTDTANVEFIVGDGARLSVVSVQDWDSGTVHISAHTALVGRDATFSHTSVDLGGAVVRLSPSVRFAGPGATAQLYGLSFAGDGQHQESRLYVDHSVPDCTSNVVYKSVLDGDTARTVWIGDVRIRPEATGTSTYELNRNLLLTEGARADSVPNLEIETGEIAGAGHASATGRFDDLQLFYLQSRGIPEDEARRLVVRGFFADVLDHIEVPELHDRLMAAIDTRLGGTPDSADER